MATLRKRGKFWHGIVTENGRKIERSLETGNINEARKRLADAGVPFREELMAPAPDWKYRVLHARTPNGYHLLLEEGSG